MAIKFCPIASGSSGNCIFVGTPETSVLIDAGLSGVRIEKGLKMIGFDMPKIDGIFVTHEHSDHIKGVGILSRRYDIPVFATEGTWSYIENSNCIGNIKPHNKKLIYKGEKCILNDLTLKPFEIPHDAVDPVGYSIFAGSHKIAVATDIGHVTDIIKENIVDSDILLLESNHDIEMLKHGTYPYPLKKRVLSDRGHLSNDSAGELLVEIMSQKLKYIYLGHLSNENNKPVLAFNTVKSILNNSRIDLNSTIKMAIASREQVSAPIFLD